MVFVNLEAVLEKLFCDGDRPADFFRFETKGARHAHTGEHHDVVKFPHDSADVQGMNDIASFQIDDQETATRLHVFCRECIIECQTTKGPVLAARRETDHGKPAMEGE